MSGLRRAREQRDARAVDAHVRAGGLVGRREWFARSESARLEREECGERVGGAVQCVVDVGAGEQPVRQVEAHLGLGLALERGAAQARQALHGPADQRRRRREHGERDDVVGPVDLEGSGRLGEEPVQRQEPDDRGRESRREAERADGEDGDEQDERRLGEVGTGRACASRNRGDGDHGQRHPDH